MIFYYFYICIIGWVTRTAGNRGYFPVFNRYQPFLKTDNLPDSQNSKAQCAERILNKIEKQFSGLTLRRSC